MPGFASAIDLRAAAPNLWAGEADLDYSHPGGQFGGWTAAALLKAAMMEEGERGPPLSMTVLFTDAIGAGPIEIETRLLRAGGRLQFWRSEATQRGKVCAHAQVTFGVRREAAGFTDAKPLFPLPPPDDPRMISFGPPTRVGQMIEIRTLPRPPELAAPDAPANAVFWARHNQRFAIDHALLAMLADFAPGGPMIKLQRMIRSSTVSMNIYFHGTEAELAAAGDDYTQIDAECRRCEGGYFDQSLRLWSRQGALLLTAEQVAAYRD
jgi:acyl-CoA thioesterase